MYKYPIIVFEGIEGSGKSFHIKNLSKYLKKKKIKYLKLREPGGSKNSEKIRNLILNKKSNFDKLTDLLLYIAARNENHKSIIEKNYKKKVIIIDRFIDSTIAYQHYGMGINKKFIVQLNNLVLKNIKLSFTFLNIYMENLKLRINSRSKKIDMIILKQVFITKYKKVTLSYQVIKKYMIIDQIKISENKIAIIKKINSLLLIWI